MDMMHPVEKAWGVPTIEVWVSAIDSREDLPVVRLQRTG